MSSRSYHGRHRGRHRAPKKPWGPSVNPTLALPGAAAVALVATATGATVAESAPLALDVSSTQALTARSQSAAAVAASSELTLRRQQASAQTAALAGRVQEQQRVAREKQRKAAEARKEAARKAEERARVVREGKIWVKPFVGLAGPGSGYGMRLHPVLGYYRMHAGNDYPAPTGTPLRAMSRGEVIFAGWSSGYGYKVEIRYWDGTVSYYGHMSRIDANVGQQVMPGDIVGAIGSTGISTGSHLHLEIHPGGGGAVNPSTWLIGRDIV